MKFTKAQRHLYYKDALENIISDKYKFICWALIHSVDKYVHLHEIPDLFPEFKSKEPKDHYRYVGWWPYGLMKPRIKCLRACIRETAPKRKTKKK